LEMRWRFTYAFIWVLRFTICTSLSAGINLHSSLKFSLCWFVVREKYCSFAEKYCWSITEE
jgi:hypothetical protein